MNLAWRVAFVIKKHFIKSVLQCNDGEFSIKCCNKYDIIGGVLLAFSQEVILLCK